MHFDKNEYMKLLTYILSNCYDKPHVGKTVISTALYFTDFNYYEIYGEPLTKETYLKSKKGIIPKHFNKITEEMQKEMQKGLDKIDQQYRIYIESHMNKLFKSDGKFDEKKSDANLNNGMTFCNVLGKFVKGCLGNKRNYDLVMNTLDNLINSTTYALGFDDFKRFEFKGVE